MGVANYYIGRSLILHETHIQILNSEKYRVVFYSGQLDIIIASPLTENFIASLNFTQADALQRAPRHIWRVEGEVAGYVKEAPNVAQILVRDAGHLVPYDQPKWAYDLISRITGGKSFRD